MSLKNLFICLFALLIGLSTASAGWMSDHAVETTATTSGADTPEEEETRPVLEPMQLIQPGSSYQLNLRAEATLPVIWPVVPELAPVAQNEAGAVHLHLKQFQETLFTCIQPAQAP